MDKQAQDKRWNELSEESKKFIKDMYDGIIKEAVKPENQKLDDEEADGNIRELWGKQTQLIELFGYDNLNPIPQIKTWEDVEKLLPEDGFCVGEYEKYADNPKVTLKCQATLKIAKLIDLGYGGLMTEEEWWNDNTLKYYIKCNPHKSEPSIECTYHASVKYFIAFHTQQQAEEFMSYESNQKLVEQYYMM